MQAYETIFNEPKTRTPNEYRKVLAAVLKKDFLTHHLYDRMVDEIVDITTSFISNENYALDSVGVVFIAVTLDIEAEQIPSRSLTPREIKTIEKSSRRGYTSQLLKRWHYPILGF